MAFSFNAPKNVCFLKSKTITQLVPHAGAITGLRTHGEAQNSAAIPDPPEVPPSYSGTGFIVSEEGVILTNSHVVENCAAIEVRDRGPATVKQVDAMNDLAPLSARGNGASVATFRSDAANLGGSVFVAGFPYSGMLSRNVNFTSGNISALAGMGNDSRFIQFTAPIQPGNSGSPLLDDRGMVVGVVTSRLADIEILKASGSLPQNVNFAIRGEMAKSFLRANGITPQLGEGDGSLPTEEVAKVAEAFTVQIICREP